MGKDTFGPRVRLNPGDLGGYLLIKGGEQLGNREVRARVGGCIRLGIHGGGGEQVRRGRVGGDGAFASRFVATPQSFSIRPLEGAPTRQNSVLKQKLSQDQGAGGDIGWGTHRH